MNRTLMNRIGTDRKGNLPESNFVKHFNSTLASDRDEFDKTIVQFMACAQACRRSKIKRREADKQAEIDARKKRQEDAEARRKAADAAAEAERRRKADAKAEADRARKRKAEDELERKRQAERDEAARKKAEADQAFNADKLTSKAHLATAVGHKDYVISCAYSTDGKKLISCGHDNTVRAWDVDTFQNIATFKGHKESVYACAVHPNGDTIVSASHDRTLRLWTISGGFFCGLLSGHTKPVRACCFSPDGLYLLSASYDRTAKIWLVSKGTCVATLKGHTSMLRCCAISNDGLECATGGDDASIRIWSMPEGKQQKLLSLHSDTVMGVSYSPDGQLFASASYDGTVKLYERPGLKCVKTLKGHNSHVFSVTFGYLSKLIATSGDKEDNFAIRVWNTETGECIAKMVGHDKMVGEVAFSPIQRLLASASHDNSLKFWDLDVAYFERGELIRRGGSHFLPSTVSRIKFLMLIHLKNSNLKNHCNHLHSISLSHLTSLLAVCTSHCLCLLYAHLTVLVGETSPITSPKGSRLDVNLEGSAALDASMHDPMQWSDNATMQVPSQRISLLYTDLDSLAHFGSPQGNPQITSLDVSQPTNSFSSLCPHTCCCS